MSVSGIWLLEETSGTIVADSSGNSQDGTTNGTPSGALGVLLTGPQSINIPVQLSSETSVGVFFFFQSTNPISNQVLLSNSSGNPSDSITIGINPTGIPYVTHLNNTIMGKEPIESSETHLGYSYDHSYNIQYLFINGVIASTMSGTSSSTNNSNTLTLGSVFSGHIRGVYLYSGVVQSNIPEGLAKGRDPTLIIPSGTVYASRVEDSGDVVHRETLYRNEYFTSSTLNANKAHFVHDEALGEVNQSSSIHHTSDGTGTLCGKLNLRVRDSELMASQVHINPGETRIGSGEGMATLDVNGLRFNSDASGLHFGTNQEFRIITDPGPPSRLVFQNYDQTTGQYVTKYCVINR